MRVYIMNVILFNFFIGTWPQGDIVLQHGQSLKILCILNQTYININYPSKNASNLVFSHNKKEVDMDYITIINETTVSLDIMQPPPADDVYYCKLRLNKGNKNDKNNNDVGVCLNKVVIGCK